MARERYNGKWVGAKTAITMLKARSHCAACVYADMERFEIWARALPDDWNGYPKESIKEIMRLGPTDKAPDMATIREEADAAYRKWLEKEDKPLIKPVDMDGCQGSKKGIEGA